MRDTCRVKSSRDATRRRRKKTKNYTQKQLACSTHTDRCSTRWLGSKVCTSSCRNSRTCSHFAPPWPTATDSGRTPRRTVTESIPPSRRRPHHRRAPSLPTRRRRPPRIRCRYQIDACGTIAIWITESEPRRRWGSIWGCFGAHKDNLIKTTRLAKDVIGLMQREARGISAGPL